MERGATTQCAKGLLGSPHTRRVLLHASLLTPLSFGWPSALPRAIPIPTVSSSTVVNATDTRLREQTVANAQHVERVLNTGPLLEEAPRYEGGILTFAYNMTTVSQKPMALYVGLLDALDQPVYGEAWGKRQRRGR